MARRLITTDRLKTNITANTVKRAFDRFYPKTLSPVSQGNLIYYLNLFAIRTSTCDTSLPDDIIGGIRLSTFNNWEIIISKASTDPSPKNLQTLFDAEARQKGGTAWVKEGQHLYTYLGTNHKKFKPLPAFAPVKPMQVYRWSPTKAEVDAAKRGGTPLSALFKTYKEKGLVKISNSTDTMIHKTWAKEKLWADSAGCQVLTDDNTLRTLGTWANDHIKKKYGNLFTYTLFTSEQFQSANNTDFRGFKLW
jgi:hypothetical protein